jgi:peptide/nickel transport system ATP-binding protein
VSTSEPAPHVTAAARRPESTADAQALLSVEDLHVGFRTSRGLVEAVDGVSLRILSGETLGLVGESGSGKSALAHSLLRLLPDNAEVSGRMTFAGQDVLSLDAAGVRRLRGRGIGMIFQDPTASLNPVRTVGAQLTESLREQDGIGHSEARRRAVELLAQVGLPDPQRQLRAYPYELSGGMCQRVMIALALAGEPRLLIADEATTALDVSVQAQILALLRDLVVERDMSMLLITHDLGVAAEVADRVAVIYSGRLAETGRSGDVFRDPEHPYTSALIGCIPRLDAPPGQPLAAIEGQAPDPLQRPPGCAFAPRCPVAIARCPTDRPSLSTREGVGHLSACWVTEDGGSPVADTVGRVKEPVAATPAPDVAQDGSAILSARELTVRYPVRGRLLSRGPRTLVAVRGISFELSPGRTLGLVGESGSGKSSTARAALRLENGTSGKLTFGGDDLLQLKGRALRRLRPRLQMVMQDITTSLNPRFSVAEAIAEPIKAHGVVPAHERRGYIAELLQAVSLPLDVADRPARELSGGQRQRVNIARALATRPDVIVADEPTSALDVSVRAQILNLMRRLQRERGLSYLFISHDLTVIRQMSDQVAVMYLGRIVEVGERDALFASPQHPYTQALLDAVPTIGGPRRGLRPISGETPSALSPPTGCPFHTRCPRAQDRCRAENPALAPVSEGQQVACFYPGSREPAP